MKKIYFIVLGMLLISLCYFNSISYAADLDRIINYVVTVDPRMDDGTLDIIYEITWKVLDSTSEGPLTWVKIGTPNSAFTNPTALSQNIEKISQYDGANVRIDFKKEYKAGEEFMFKYSIHQPYMYKLSGKKCTYDFTPAWFTEIKVDKLKIKWNADSVLKCDTKVIEDNYYVWQKESLKKGEKLSVDLEYEQSAFGYLYNNKQVGSLKYKNTNGYSTGGWIVFFVMIIVLCCFISAGDGGYGAHSGFYGGYRGGGCVSSCACACARSCACACAGSGRAGCSKKDFYGTKLNSKKIKKSLEM